MQRIGIEQRAIDIEQQRRAGFRHFYSALVRFRRHRDATSNHDWVDLSSDSSRCIGWSVVIGRVHMRDELIFVEPRQEALVEFDAVSMAFPTVPEAYIAWAQLELDEKERAVIQVGEERYGISAIRRFRYEPVARAA
jgi:hypothetical protein